MFDARTARRQLTAYRRSGPTGSTRRLVENIKAAGVDGATVLDIGGGVGVIGFELLAAGADRLTGVDAARAYVAVARREATRRGLDDRATFHHGDFVALADEVGAADIVTLDRVICCCGDWAALVDRSVARARRLYGLVYPTDRWWTRAGIGTGNLMLRLSRRSFRGYVHPERAVDGRIRAAGFERPSHHSGWLWQTAIYERIQTA
jgi:predicted TPR repeat methyltransferase